MPYYELLLVLRPMPKNQVVDCLKRTAQTVWSENGVLKKIEYLGDQKLPYKRPTPNEDKIRPELKLDLDIIRASWNLQSRSKIPDDYSCTVQEENQIPFFRPKIQALLYNKNIRLSKPNLSRRDYHMMSCDYSNSTHTPGLMSIFENNPKRLERIQFLDKLFKQADHEIRIAGGAVRDILRGEEPSDIDFATTSVPEKTLELVTKHEDLLRIITTTTGLKHGTVAVKFKGEVEGVYDDENPFEITTLRSDNITDGRHAEVEFIKDWKMDAERRDLTINAMFLTLDKGELIDYYGGESDLKNGIVRFVGNADDRIKEDYLRILRYFRFWSRYGQNKRPDESTLTTIRENLQGFEKIKGERIWVEVKKIFSHYPVDSTVKLMLELDLFEHIDVFDNDQPIDQDRVIKDLSSVQEYVSIYSKTKLEPRLKERPHDVNLKRMKEILPTIQFATVFETSHMCMQAHARLKFSNLERDTLLYIVEKRNIDKDSLKLDELKRELVKTPPSEIHLMRNRMSAFLIYMGRLDLLDEFNEWPIPSFPINGHEIVQEIAKRKVPRHRVKNILQYVREKWASEDFKPTKEDLWPYMEEEIDRYQENGAK